MEALLTASRSAAEHGCTVALVPGPDSVHRAFVLTGLDSALGFEPSPVR